MRNALFDNYLTGKDLVGAEVGVDAGEHAEALLQKDIKKLYLIDPWPNKKSFTLCQEKLKPYSDKIVYLDIPSLEAVKKVPDDSLDFIYFDQHHEYEVVLYDLETWYPKVKTGGWIGERGYMDKYEGVVDAVNYFTLKYEVDFKAEGEDAIWQKR